MLTWYTFYVVKPNCTTNIIKYNFALFPVMPSSKWHYKNKFIKDMYIIPYAILLWSSNLVQYTPSLIDQNLPPIMQYLFDTSVTNEPGILYCEYFDFYCCVWLCVDYFVIDKNFNYNDIMDCMGWRQLDFKVEVVKLRRIWKNWLFLLGNVLDIQFLITSTCM